MSAKPYVFAFTELREAAKAVLRDSQAKRGAIGGFTPNEWALYRAIQRSEPNGPLDDWTGPRLKTRRETYPGQKIESPTWVQPVQDYDGEEHA